jgi:hypothetical protein
MLSVRQICLHVAPCSSLATVPCCSANESSIASSRLQAADVIAGWVVNKETRTLFDLDEFGQKCNQFQFMKKLKMQAACCVLAAQATRTIRN